MKLYANVIGNQGTPLLILHGIFGMGDNWKTLGKRLSEAHNVQVHLLDARNHGRSPHAKEFNYKVMAEDIKDYCAQNKLKKIVLIGHSMGGKTAMNVAVDHPDLLDALIVVDIAPKEYPPHHQTILKGLFMLYNEALSSRKEADQKLSEVIDNLGIRQFLLKNLYRKEKNQLALRLNLPVIKDNIEEIGKTIKNTATYTGPTLFVKGAQSDYIKKEDRNLLDKHFPKSQLLTIKGAGHWIHAEKPNEIFEGLISFLKHHNL